MTEEGLKRLLNRKLIEIADALMEYYNPCNLRGNTCRGGNPNPCCTNSYYGPGLCPHWRHSKCRNENCDCKLWLCASAVEATDPVGVQAFKTLEEFGLLYGLTNRPIIGEAYSGADRQPE